MKRHLVALLLAAPPALALGGVLTVAAAERAGFRLLAPPAPRNSAEAAAVGDAASTLQLLARERPGIVHRLRPGLLSDGIAAATTVEAAVWSRQLELIEVLDDRSLVTADPGGRMALACLAVDVDAEEIALYLAGAEPACEPGAALSRMRARSD
jgi:hypothetical protein